MEKPPFYGTVIVLCITIVLGWVVSDDVVKLASWLENRLLNFNSLEYEEVAKLALARLITYNRRRPGEMQALK